MRSVLHGPPLAWWVLKKDQVEERTPMPATPIKPDDGAWETELAPRVSKRYLVTTIVFFMIWLCFLGYHAARRWFGVMQ